MYISIYLSIYIYLYLHLYIYICVCVSISISISIHMCILGYLRRWRRNGYRPGAFGARPPTVFGVGGSVHTGSSAVHTGSSAVHTGASELAIPELAQLRRRLEPRGGPGGKGVRS